MRLSSSAGVQIGVARPSSSVRRIHVAQIGVGWWMYVDSTSAMCPGGARLGWSFTPGSWEQHWMIVPLMLSGSFETFIVKVPAFLSPI